MTNRRFDKNQYTTIITMKDINTFTFPSTVEDHVIVNIEPSKFDSDYILIEFKFGRDYNSSIMHLLLVTDAIRRLNYKKIDLFIPFVPFARQDRLMMQGEPFSLKVFADLINMQNYNKVIMYDPHSDVTPALINRSEVINNHVFVHAMILKFIDEDYIIISPDAGSYKKIFDVCKYINYTADISMCNKKRDVSTGEIIDIYCDVDDYQGKNCVIIDDICDGGGTFILLANELRKLNCGKLYLVVSHGIFSKGLDELASVFDRIFTTDSFVNKEEQFTSKFYTFNL